MALGLKLPTMRKMPIRYSKWDLFLFNITSILWFRSIFYSVNFHPVLLFLNVAPPLLCSPLNCSFSPISPTGSLCLICRPSSDFPREFTSLFPLVSHLFTNFQRIFVVFTFLFTANQTFFCIVNRTPECLCLAI